MPFRKYLQPVYYALLCFLAFAIPLTFNLAALAIVLLSICWFFQMDFKVNFQRLVRRKALWLWIIFYLLHLIGYLYSTDKEHAAFELLMKLSFLLLPIAIGTGPEIEEKHLEKVLTAYIAGSVLLAILCFSRAIYVFAAHGDAHHFFYHGLIEGFDANAVYTSMYIIMALSILIFYPWRSLLNNKLLMRSAFALLLVFFIMLASKTLIILFPLVVVPLYYFRVGRHKISRPAVIAAVIGALLFTSLVVFTHNPIRARYENMFLNLNQGLVTNQNQEFNNLTLRLFLWKMAIDDVRDNNLWLAGCGTGDVILMQKKTIMAYNAHAHSLDKHPPLWNFNMHNMYFHTLLMLGLIGLSVLLLIIIVPFFMLSKMPHRELVLVFYISIAIFYFQEAALQTQAGIVLSAFFAQLFYNLYYNKKERDQGLSSEA